MQPVKKNILIVSVANSWGGGEEFLLRLFENVKDYNFVFVSPPGESYGIYQQNSIKVILIRSLKKIFRNGDSWAFISKLKITCNVFVSTFFLIRAIFHYKVDFILANGNFAALQSLPAALLTSKKILVMQHLIYKEVSVEAKILRTLNRFIFRIVCVSNSVEENVRGILISRSHNKIITIRHGIEPPVFDMITNNGHNNIRVGVVGSIIRLKSIDTIIVAVNRILPDNKNILLRIYGSVRTSEPDSLVYETELKKMIKESGNSDKICFCGFEKSKQKLYSDIDIVINYSKIAEAFSFTVLEAMAFGKIVIASDIGGPKEIITNGYDGFLIAPSDAEALYQKLGYCIRNFHSDEMIRVKNNARKTVEERFSMKNFSQQYKRLFDSV
ncbi:MAG: glycosyltransferase family 4 protein [Ignavibacteriaceae bacterium]